ncbi:MAG: GNAT family protein [Pseudomonadota bacterium]
MSRTVSTAPVDTVPRARPLAGRVDGTSVRLERLDVERHCEPLFRCSHIENKARVVWDFLPHGPFGTVAEFEVWLTDFVGPDDGEYYVVVDQADAEPKGMFSLRNIRVDLATLELDYLWFAPALQRTRGATEAMYLLFRWLFDDLRYRRISWRSDAANSRCCRAAERLGFVREGTLYQHAIVKGRNRDAAQYALLDREWPAVASRMQRWLHPDNFDTGGQQRTRLAEV